MTQPLTRPSRYLRRLSPNSPTISPISRRPLVKPTTLTLRAWASQMPILSGVSDPQLNGVFGTAGSARHALIPIIVAVRPPATPEERHGCDPALRLLRPLLGARRAVALGAAPVPVPLFARHLGRRPGFAALCAGVLMRAPRRRAVRGPDLHRG